MIDWRKFGSDPLAGSAQATVRAFLRRVSAVHRGTIREFYRNVCRGQDVLHLGFVEHQIAYMERSGWQHRSICDVAAKCTGVDIDEEGVEYARVAGYEAICADVTKPYGLGRAFDVVVAGDIIEHLGCVDGFMKYLERAVAPGGRVYVSTPNPFYVLFFLLSITRPPFVANLEHVAWISESCMLELARRQGIELEGIWYITGGGTSRTVQRLKGWIAPLIPTLLCSTLVYVLRRRSQLVAEGGGV